MNETKVICKRVCDGCNAQISLSVFNVTDTEYYEDKLSIKAEKKGWSIGFDFDEHYCPKCTQVSAIVMEKGT
jgi:hypothetical protein